MSATSHGFRAQITLGLRKGYGGSVQEKTEVLSLISDLQRRAVAGGRPYLPFVIAETVISYPVNERRTEREPGLALTTDQAAAPDAGDEAAWRELVLFYAQALADAFEQEVVSVTFWPAEIVRVRREARKGP